MSYSNPDILIIENPIGLDAVIQTYQQDLYAGLPWLTKSFGRAREFKEDGRKTPKAYMGLGEYHNVLPNDSLQAQSFIMAREQEKWDKYPYSDLSRDLSIVFWANLKEINPNKDYIYTEELRWDVEKIIKENPYTKSINAYWDDRVEDVFMGYIGENRGVDGQEEKGQLLMYPYAGFRYDITAIYPEHANCVRWVNPFNPAVEYLDDIDFVIGDDLKGLTVYQNNKLKGRKIRLIREGLVQHTQNVGANWYWSFSSATGTITVNPAWIKDERVKIEIYGFAK
jgi:hypothetical protein